MRGRCWAALPGLLVVAASAFAADARVALDSALHWGLDPGASRSVQRELMLAPELELDGRRWRARLSGRARFDDADHLEPGDSDTALYSGASAPWTPSATATLELRDAYLEGYVGRQLLRLGKQQIVWGALDGIKVLDALNPQSFREFILEDFGSSRTTLWSAYLDLTAAGWRGELALIPDASLHRLPGPSAWFELRAPRFRFGAEPGDPGLTIASDGPALSVREGTAAIRLSRPLGSLDVSLVALSGNDFEPLGRLRLADGEAVLERFARRRSLYGLGLESAFGAFAWRAEIAYQPQRDVNVRTARGLGTVQRDQWRGALGLDWAGPLELFVNVQYLIDDVERGDETLLRPARDHVFTAFVRRSFSYDRITAELRWYGESGRGDGLGKAALRWRGGNTTVALAGETFYGDRRGLFGQFRERERLTLTLEHRF